MMQDTELEQAIHLKLFLREDASYSIWDHPNFKSHMVLPDDYRPLSSLMSVLEAMNRWSTDVRENRMILLKVIGDAMCANENQLRRYLSSKMSASETSKHINNLRKYGFIERHKARISFEDEETEIRPPAPVTLGPAGYLLMKHYYAEQAFSNAETWQGNPLAIQRIVAVNELRCVTAEAKVLKSWNWYPNVGGLNKYPSPTAFMQLKTVNEELVDFLVIRTQLAQNFHPFLLKTLESYRYLHERDGRILVDCANNKNYQIILLSVSTVALAEYIAEQIQLNGYPFDIWFVIDENYDNLEDAKDLSKAFYGVEKGKIVKLNLQF